MKYQLWINYVQHKITHGGPNWSMVGFFDTLEEVDKEIITKYNGRDIKDFTVVEVNTFTGTITKKKLPTEPLESNTTIQPTKS